MYPVVPRLLFCLGLVLPAAAIAAEPTPARPNVILILVDDMGWGNVGCFGGTVETPNIDRLASGGVRFNQFYSNARCCPTRAVLMTGLAPHQAGVGHMTFRRTGKAPSRMEERMQVPASYRGFLSEAVPTLPEMLREAGYATFMSGKWHLGSDNPAHWPVQRGFDRFYGFLEGTSQYFAPEDLHRGNEPIQPQGERYYTTDAFTQEALGFIREHRAAKDARPFFLYLAYNAPHFPMQAMPEDFAKYRGRYRVGWDVLREKILARQKELGLVPANTTLAPRPSTPGNKLGLPGGPVPAWSDLTPQQQDEMDAIMATYSGMIDRVDQNIGKLLQDLQASGELENTLIFFLSDNGAEAEAPELGRFQMSNLGQYGKGGARYGRAWATVSNTPFRDYKHFAHQGGVQTPLIVHWPRGLKPELRGQVVTQFGFLPDIVETCLAVGGAKRPAVRQGQPVPASDGENLQPVLQGGSAPLHRTPVCIEHEGNRLVRDGRWKLVGYANQPWELYDMETDRSEAHDVAKAQPEVVARLSAAYGAWAARAGVRPWSEARKYSVYPDER
ncbi:arylsulfatase [Opitutus sp. ER46]|uniref:arylsulfatase n=1 Tax=Opitutus sp. ER46 TaxID=2161864 RepID=UPI000D2F4B20|nr:arylsulfatase [Opitutus sp. ER46]PTX95647.1 arylsulfatase [Opitutus sp. ER46]